MITINPITDDVGPDLKRLLRSMERPRAGYAAGGRAMRNHLVKHLRGLDRTNPIGMPGAKRQHFWLATSRSVQNPEITDHSATVTISDPRVAYRFFGGTITPKRVRFLTIPATGESYGITARTFEAEKGVKLFAMGTAGAGVLAYRSEKGTLPIVAFLLKRSVTKGPEPDKQPNLTAMSREVLAAVRGAVDREILRNQQAR